LKFEVNLRTWICCWRY